MVSTYKHCFRAVTYKHSNDSVNCMHIYSPSYSTTFLYVGCGSYTRRQIRSPTRGLPNCVKEHYPLLAPASSFRSWWASKISMQNVGCGGHFCFMFAELQCGLNPAWKGGSCQSESQCFPMGYAGVFRVPRCHSQSIHFLLYAFRVEAPVILHPCSDAPHYSDGMCS